MPTPAPAGHVLVGTQAWAGCVEWLGFVQSGVSGSWSETVWSLDLGWNPAGLAAQRERPAGKVRTGLWGWLRAPCLALDGLQRD